MAGNVAEWVQDRYSSSYANAQAVINPMGPSEGERRVIRGGSYIHGAEGARCAARHQARPPWWVHRSIGFRIGRYLPPEREADLEGLARGGLGEEGK